MPDLLNAPWTPEQVEILAQLQRGERFGQPFTCPHRDETPHRYTGPDCGCLTPTAAGWICEDCGYTQDWVWASSLDLPLLADLQRSMAASRGPDPANS
jgi:hypothetical protein